jgi:hypothetical protein
MPTAGKTSSVPTELPNITEIQSTLWEQVQNLREGKTTPANANAVSNAIGKMFTGVKLQMEYYRLTGATPVIPFLLTKTE